MTRKIVELFPLWAITLSFIAYVWPQPFVVAKPAIIYLLAVVMFGMGMTLTWDHFRNALRQPVIIGLTLLIQFLCMPLFAYLTAYLLGLSSAQTVGMVLVGASAGGAASNVICYLARGNVALSILLTMSSTLVAVVAMPGLTYFYLHQTVPVPFTEMLTSIVNIVLIPVVLGTAVNSTLGRYLFGLGDVFPLISSTAIVAIIAIIVGLNQANIAELSPIVLTAVALHNAAGLAAGYTVPRFLGYDRVTCRTVSIEVGMQNSGLSVALAIKYFSEPAALPGAIFSIWHNLSGSLLASFWRRGMLQKTAPRPTVPD
ncbi:MAG: bile acid:sodium symporter family protein [Pseudomonadota bacterium]